MSAKSRPYVEARAAKGLWLASRYLVLRRLSQLGFLALFLSGPLLGVWIARGTLASSMTLDVLPLTDPLVLLQSLAAGHAPALTALAGAAIVTAAYLLLGGRTYCAWVCPVNPVTDLASWLRRRLGITRGARLSPHWRRWMVPVVLVASAVTGTVAWELVNPVTALHRALVFGLGLGALGALAIFLFDLLVAADGWCGHLCPVGAFYGALGRVSVLRVAAPRRAACDDCMDCFAVCPEPQVIVPALKGERTGQGPVILAGDCTACGACVDACPERVFRFTHRFDLRTEPAAPIRPSRAGRTLPAPPDALERSAP